MYNATELKAGLIGLIGWRQNGDQTGVQLTELTSSSSGMFFNDEHPLLTIDNLLSIAPEFNRIHTTSIAINTAFTAWLRAKTEAGIIRAVEAWLGAKFEKRSAKNLLSRKDLLTVAGRAHVLDSNTADWVGLELLPYRAKGVVANIERVALQFTEAQSVTIYLYHTDSPAPLQTQTISYVTPLAVQWASLNWSLDKAAGAYYIAYDQSAISGSSVNGVNDYTAEWAGANRFPCGGRWLRVAGFQANQAPVTGGPVAYTLATNWGLNLAVNVQCDYTDLLLEQKDLFKTLISKQVAMDLLRELAYNPNSRVNRHESNVDLRQILYEIDGDSQGSRKGSLRDQFEKALNGVMLDMGGLDKACLPCRRWATKIRTI